MDLLQTRHLASCIIVAPLYAAKALVWSTGILIVASEFCFMKHVPIWRRRTAETSSSEHRSDKYLGHPASLFLYLVSHITWNKGLLKYIRNTVFPYVT